MFFLNSETTFKSRCTAYANILKRKGAGCIGLLIILVLKVLYLLSLFENIGDFHLSKLDRVEQTSSVETYSTF